MGGLGLGTQTLPPTTVKEWECKAKGWGCKDKVWECRAKGWECRAKGWECRAKGWESEPRDGDARTRNGDAEPGNGNGDAAAGKHAGDEHVRVVDVWVQHRDDVHDTYDAHDAHGGAHDAHDAHGQPADVQHRRRSVCFDRSTCSLPGWGHRDGLYWPGPAHSPSLGRPSRQHGRRAL